MSIVNVYWKQEKFEIDMEIKKFFETEIFLNNVWKILEFRP